MDSEQPKSVSRAKQANAYWDLRGLIGQWMEEYGQDRIALMMYLQRIVAEQLMGLHCNYEWRLRRIEEVLELPAHGGEIEPIPGLGFVNGVPYLLTGEIALEEDAS